MKRIATLVNKKGQVIGLVHGPDEIGKHVTVDGRKWFFDFDEYFGPLWLKEDRTTERRCQNPKKEVWEAFQRWLDRRTKRLGQKSQKSQKPQKLLTLS